MCQPVFFSHADNSSFIRLLPALINAFSDSAEVIAQILKWDLVLHQAFVGVTWTLSLSDRKSKELSGNTQTLNFSSPADSCFCDRRRLFFVWTSRRLRHSGGVDEGFASAALRQTLQCFYLRNKEGSVSQQKLRSRFKFVQTFLFFWAMSVG